MFRNPLEERGGRVCNARNTFFSKKSSLRALRAHNVCTYYAVLCPHTGCKGDKIRIGCLTRAFWEAHKWAEMLHHPCILGGPQQRGQNQSGPTSGRKCYITPAFSGIPKERGQSQSKKKAKKTKTKTVPWCP